MCRNDPYIRVVRLDVIMRFVVNIILHSFGGHIIT